MFGEDGGAERWKGLVPKGHGVLSCLLLDLLPEVKIDFCFVSVTLSVSVYLWEDAGRKVRGHLFWAWWTRVQKAAGSHLAEWVACRPEGGSRLGGPGSLNTASHPALPRRTWWAGKGALSDLGLTLALHLGPFLSFRNPEPVPDLRVVCLADSSLMVLLSEHGFCCLT